MKSLRSLSRQNAVELEEYRSEFNSSLEQYFTAIVINPHPPSYDILYNSFERSNSSENINYDRKRICKNKFIEYKKNDLTEKNEISKKKDSISIKSNNNTEVSVETCPKVIHKCCKAGDFEIVRLLLISPSTDVNAICIIDDVCDITPLHLAVQNKHLQVAKQLLKAGCVVDKPQIVQHR